VREVQSLLWSEATDVFQAQGQEVARLAAGPAPHGGRAFIGGRRFQRTFRVGHDAQGCLKNRSDEKRAGSRSRIITWIYTTVPSLCRRVEPSTLLGRRKTFQPS